MLTDKAWIRASRAGIFKSEVRCGQDIYKDQVIAHIADPYGDHMYMVKCYRNGHVIGLNNSPVVNRGDALFHIGYAKR